MSILGFMKAGVDAGFTGKAKMKGRRRNSLNALVGDTGSSSRSSSKSSSKTASGSSSKKSTSTRPDIVETNFSDATERSKARNAKK